MSKRISDKTMAAKKTIDKRSKALLFDKINSIAERYSEKSILLFFLLVAFVLSIINFNARISEAHDDALYVEAAYRFVAEFPNYFYTANAPFYPMFLAFLMKIVGFQLIVFKLFNVLFLLLSVYCFFKAFYRTIPFIVFIPVIFFVALNHHVIYFSSMTFTESMFMFLQGFMFYTMRRLIDRYSSLEKTLWSYIKALSLFGLSAFLLIVTRSGSIVVVPAMLLFFWHVLKNKKLTLASLISILIYYLPYKFVIRIIFGEINQYANQSKILMQKDPYDVSLGQETISGFIQRFFDNSQLYLSKRFFQMIGWMSEENTNIYGIIALLLFALLLWGTWLAYKKKNRLMLFASIYTLGLMTLSFIILQARWDQPRIIMVAMPMMIGIYFYLFSLLFKSKFFKTLYVLLLFLFVGSMIVSTTKRGIKNIPIVLRNLQGDVYYGYTPDWQNFLRASEWCGKNLPATAYVASRKSPMSFIYGKRKFFPIYSVIKKDPETNQSHPDSALVYFKQNHVTHVLLANLRIDPNKNTGQVVNTIHNILEPIVRKYPHALKIVHTEGDTEPCYVYEIVYPEK